MATKPPLGKSIDIYYHLASGGARLKLFESVIDLHLVETIGLEGSLTLEEIIDKLKLHPIRAQKWLYLLSSEDFLTERKLENQNTYAYSLGPVLKALRQNEAAWWFYKELLNSWRLISFEDMANMLQGGNITNDVTWPPKTELDSLSLESWMSNTAKSVVNLLNKHIAFKDAKNLLDVGGGEGTIDCLLAELYPQLSFTVYNLPEAVKLAHKKIEGLNLSDRITVIEGNFLTDTALPKGYDIILISRVLCDWSAEVSKKVLTMAYEALNDSGYVVICEPFTDLNQNLMLVWEIRYLFWDAFGQRTFKSISTYQDMLKEIGFKYSEYSGVDENSSYRVIKAYKNNPLSI